MGTSEMSWRINYFDSGVSDHWCTVKVSDKEYLFGASRIVKLRLFAAKCPSSLLTLNTLSTAGDAIRQTDADILARSVPPQNHTSSDQTQPHSAQTLRKTNKAMEKTGVTFPDASHVKKPERNASVSSKTPKTIAEINAALNSRPITSIAVLTAEQDTMEIDVDGTTVVLEHTRSDDSANMKQSLLDARIGRSGSSKLNWILDEVSSISLATLCQNESL